MKKERLLSLDAFRGFTIFGMIIVNNPGSWEHVYSPLLHSHWAGCTPTDLVFPFFLFIVGVSMWFSFKAFDYKLSKRAFIKIVRRSLVIFLVGAFLNAFPFTDFQWLTFRIMGVLQRIALTYALSAILCMLLNKRNLIIAAISILLGYFLILIAGSGHEPFSLAGNLVRQFDVAVFGEQHLYKGFGIPFDPEGLLSTLPSIATVIIGFLTGSFLESSENKEPVLLRFMLVGALLILSGIIASYAMPIIKALWTSSYVLYTAGLALVSLSFFIYAIDLKGWRKIGQPFIIFGSNPLFIYALSGILGTLVYIITVGETSLKEYVYNNYLIHILGYRSGSLLGALLLTGICWLVAWLLYRKKIYIKI
jgi:predicted acyltransferase